MLEDVDVSPFNVAFNGGYDQLPDTFDNSLFAGGRGLFAGGRGLAFFVSLLTPFRGMEGIHLLLGDLDDLLPPYGVSSWLAAKDNTRDSFGELRCVFSLEPRMLRSSGTAKVTRTTLLSGRASCHLVCSLWHDYLPAFRVRPLFGFLPPTPITLLFEMILANLLAIALSFFWGIATSLTYEFDRFLFSAFSYRWPSFPS